MRAEDFNLENLMDHMEYKMLDVPEALTSAYPGMTEDDMTEDEHDDLRSKMGQCGECYIPMRYGNLEWNDNLRADVCDDCDMQNRDWGDDWDEEPAEDED